MMKRCKTCNIEKAASEFHKHSGTKDGLRPDCKDCRKIECSQYYDANKEKILKRGANYYILNKDKMARTHAAYYQNNKEWFASYHQNYMMDENKRKEAQAYWNQYYVEHRDERMALTHNRRAKILSLPYENISITEVGKTNGWICQLCFKTIDQTLQYPDPMSKSLDHITPVSKDGPHLRYNVQIAHLLCNLRKGNKYESLQ